MIHETNLSKPPRTTRLRVAAGLAGLTALVIGVSLLTRDEPQQHEVHNLVELAESDTSAYVATGREEFVRTVEVQLDRLHRIVDEVAPEAAPADVDALRGLHVSIATRLLQLRGDAPSDWTELREDVLEDLEVMSDSTYELVEELS